MQAQGIKSIKKLGQQNTIDLEVDHPDHNFYAEGIVTSNSHSISTAYLSALTTYLKYKYPLVFYWACLKNVKHFSDPTAEITQIHSELKYFNIQLLPPDILKSKENFEIEGNNIRMGLSAIKGLSEAALTKLKGFQSVITNRFDLFASLNEANIPLNVATALILSGCFDSIRGGITRNKLLFEYEIWNLLTEKEIIYMKSLGFKYNFDFFNTLKALQVEIKDEKNKPIIKESRYETIKKKAAPFKEKYLKNSKYELLSAWIFEQRYIGFSYSLRLIDIYSKSISDLVTVEDIKIASDEMRVRLVGVVEEIEQRVSREAKNPYLRMIVKDDFSIITCMLFSQDRINATNSFNGKEIEEGDIVVVNGKKKGDAIFIDTVVIQDNPIIIKKSQLLNPDKIKI